MLLGLLPVLLSPLALDGVLGLRGTGDCLPNASALLALACAIDVSRRGSGLSFSSFGTRSKSAFEGAAFEGLELGDDGPHCDIKLSTAEKDQ